MSGSDPCGQALSPNEKQVAQLVKKDYSGKATVSEATRCPEPLSCMSPAEEGEGTP